VCDIRVSLTVLGISTSRRRTNTCQLDLVLWRLFEALLWNLIHVKLLALRILRWILDFCKICKPLNIILSCIDVTGNSTVFPVSPHGSNRQYPKYIMKFTAYSCRSDDFIR